MIPFQPPSAAIFALCAARSFAYLNDMSALVMLLRLEHGIHIRGQRFHYLCSDL
nr:lipoprotein signal peptidase [Neisseria dumasiana]